MRRPLSLLLVLLGAAVASAADDGSRAGRVVLSDGTVREGRLSFTQGARLHVVDPASGRGRDLDPATVAALLFRVERESLERPYTFKTPGKDDKTYGEGLFPRRDLLCTVVLRSGERLDGHLRTTVVFVETAPDAEAERFVLRRQWEGAVGDTLDDLVYPREVRFADAADETAAAPATLVVTVRGAGPVAAAAAYGHASRLVFAGVVEDPAAGRVRFDGLPSDAYDVAWRGRDLVLVGGVRPAAAARPLVDGEDGAPLAEIVAKGDDLYDARDLLFAGGDRDAARLVVEKRVKRPTTNDAAFGRRGALWALDVWTAHRLEREWRIDARSNVLRVVLREGEEPPRVAVEKGLGAVPLRAGEHAVREVERTQEPR